ncbi:hypothetical protein [Streptomyces sp. XH2]|uniref:hypothetical protein n=1 Tax=Streptomyces sp. XH2 TaxID=3412483 RepID=UPI003C7B861E
MTIPEPSVAVELERLRGSVDTGFARLEGRLDVLLQRTTAAETDIAAMEARIAALEKARWPLPSLAAIVGVAALLLSLYGTIAR